MRVLHIIDSGGLYGAEVMLLNLVEEQISQGLSPVIASIGTPDSEEKHLEREAHKRHLPLEIFRFKAGINFQGAFRILKYAREHQFTLLHSHGYKGNILFGLLPGRVRKFPIISTLHGWTSTGGLTKMALYEYLDAYSLSRVDHVVFVNKLMGDHPRLRTLSKNKTSVICNGIPVEKAQRASISKAIENFVQRRFTIVAVGRFSPEKGFDLLLRSVSELVSDGLDIQLLLLGEGQLREAYTSQISRLHLEERVLMPGHVENVPEYLKICQLFAMPSLSEGLPIALLEAMAAEMPIIAARVGGIPDALLDGRAGYLMERGSQSDLTDLIRRVHQAGANSSTAMTALARKRVSEEFSSCVMADNYLYLYHRLINS